LEVKGASFYLSTDRGRGGISAKGGGVEQRDGGHLHRRPGPPSNQPGHQYKIGFLIAIIRADGGACTLKLYLPTRPGDISPPKG